MRVFAALALVTLASSSSACAQDSSLDRARTYLDGLPSNFENFGGYPAPDHQAVIHDYRCGGQQFHLSFEVSDQNRPDRWGVSLVAIQTPWGSPSPGDTARINAELAELRNIDRVSIRCSEADAAQVVWVTGAARDVGKGDIDILFWFIGVDLDRIQRP